MENFCRQLNDVLVGTYRSISRLEASLIEKKSGLNLSISEVHLIEAIGRGPAQGCTISGIAQELAVTLSSVTVAVNKLVRKGYAVKQRDKADGRQVLVSLTRKGQKVDRIHQRFHLRLAKAVAAQLNDQEKATLVSGIGKLNTFFRQKLAGLEE